MALVTLNEVLTALDLCSQPAATQTRYDALREYAEAAAKNWVKWEIESANATDFYDGNSNRDIVLRRPYVNSITNVWVDQSGFYGSPGNTAFASATLLTQGADYALVLDDGSRGRSGLLRKLTYSTPYLYPSDLMFQRMGGLAYSNPATWPLGYGNVKVAYSYGFTTIPDDIKIAVITAVSIMATTAQRGFPALSEGLGAHNWSLSIAREPEFGTVRQLLGRYRDMSI